MQSIFHELRGKGRLGHGPEIQDNSGGLVPSDAMLPFSCINVGNARDPGADAQPDGQGRLGFLGNGRDGELAEVHVPAGGAGLLGVALVQALLLHGTKVRFPLEEGVELANPADQVELGDLEGNANGGRHDNRGRKGSGEKKKRSMGI